MNDLIFARTVSLLRWGQAQYLGYSNPFTNSALEISRALSQQVDVTCIFSIKMKIAPL
jgi:hypothetical protein